MENTPIQKKIIRNYENMAKVQKVYPTFTDLALKSGVSRKYAHRVIQEYRTQNKAFGLK